MTRDFDFAKGFETAHFILIGHGDGRGTDHVVGYRDLCNRVEEDCGEVIDCSAWHEEWAWSDESPSRPYYLHMSFEAEGLTIVRLGDEAVKALRASAPETFNPEADIAKMLQDPAVVHLNMLRGGIAKPSWANIKHLYPEQFAENANSTPTPSTAMTAPAADLDTLSRVIDDTFEALGVTDNEAALVEIDRLKAAATPPSAGNADAVREALTDAETWCSDQAYKIGNVDGYDYRSGEEAAYRHAAIEMKKRAALSAPVDGAWQEETLWRRLDLGDGHHGYDQVVAFVPRKERLNHD